MEILTIQTGSKGNAYVIKYKNESIMIEAGSKMIKDYETKINFNKIKYLFISHSHGDHCEFIDKFTKIYKPTIITNPETYNHIDSKLNAKIKRLNLEEDKWYELETWLKVKPIHVPHDAYNWAYIIHFFDKKFAFVTDIGKVESKLHEDKDFKNLDLLMFEANYDENLIHLSNIDGSIKSRITSDKGHLSLKESKHFIESLNNEKMLVLLIHKSTVHTNEEVCHEFIKNKPKWIWAQKNQKIKLEN